MFCQKCGKEIPDTAKFCTGCGNPVEQNQPKTKFCKHCGQEIDAACVVCPKCGKQVEELKQSMPVQSAPPPQVVVNNTNVNTNANVAARPFIVPQTYLPPKNKWVAFFLCLFLGWRGAHKFYENKAFMGILYLFTMGLFGIGVIIDLIVILTKPRIYYTK